MKTSFHIPLLSLIILGGALAADAQTTFTLNPFSSFGSRGDGSIQPVAAPQPSDSIGVSPMTGYNVLIGAPNATSALFVNPTNSALNETNLDTRTTGTTNGFNMRGLTWDAVSGNLIFVDTHEGSGGTVGGAGAIMPFSAIYILDATNGTIVGALSTNGILGGAYTHVCAGAADDGVIYVCNQTTASQTTGFKIYRWPTANTNDPAFSSAPVVAYSNLVSGAIGTSGERLGETMDVRGAGTNTQIIVGSSSLNGTGTNIFLFNTTDGTNFAAHRISFPQVITSAVFNDGIAFGPTNTFFSKQVGKPFLYMAYDAAALATGTNQIAGTVIPSFTASSVNDPLLNISAIAYDPVNKLLGGLEEIGGIATGGRGKVWLFDLSRPTNTAPAVLSSRTYVPNFAKTTAPMGYLKFGTNGVLYANASNNGLLASRVDVAILAAPTFSTDLPASTRVAEATTVHFEVFAVVDVTNYQWYSNNVPISGANTYFYNLPNASSNMLSPVFKVVAFNAAGSSTSVSSTLTVVSAANFFHPNLLWSVPANTLALNNTTNFITSNGGSGTPFERTIAYNALSNQLLVLRGPTMANLKIMVIDADKGTNGYLYTLKTNGIAGSAQIPMVGLGVADDGAVYACGVSGANGSDQSFRVYRWADSGSNTLPVCIFGTNVAATAGFLGNPVYDWTVAQTWRFGDNLTVHGSGTTTEILIDSQNVTKFAGILTPTDSTMTNWTTSGYLYQNAIGSYGSEAYGTVIGRSLQFGSGNTFWLKRYNTAAAGLPGAPLSEMSYSPGVSAGAFFLLANTSPGLFTNGAVAINFTLNVAAGINFSGAVGSDGTASTAQDTLSYYDFTDPSQAVLLSSAALPQGNGGFHKANGNAVGQVVFGVNPISNTNYIFVIDGNNGVAAFTLSGGTTPPPKLLTQPHNLRALLGSSVALNASADQIATIRWFKGTNPPVNTTVQGLAYSITNAQLADAGDYFVTVSNVNGMATSTVAHVFIALPQDNYSMFQEWAANPANGSAPYVTTDGGANTPNERAFTYNALSNQLIVVRCPPGSTAYTVSVVNATSGTFLYALNTAGVVHEGASEVPGSNPIDLVAAATSDDGSIYICSESPNASGGAVGDTSKMFHVFRWTNSAPTTPAVLVYQGDPSAQSAGINFRWGDVMAVRGGGASTELSVNSQDGSYGAVLVPTDATLNIFTNLWFNDSGGGGSIGRSIQFGPTNSVFEKRKGSALIASTYNTNSQNSSAFLAVDSSTTLGGVFLDTTHSLAVGVDFVGSTTTLAPDAVSIYDISDPLTPMFLQSYNFPVPKVANANVICQTIIYGDKVWALDANNGMLAFTLTSPVIPSLNITPAGTSVALSWPLYTGGYKLQASSSLTGTWTNVAPDPMIVGGQNVVTNPVTPSALFYRLKH